jgi:hypothetical protein
LTKEAAADTEEVKAKLAAGVELVWSTLLEHESGHTGQLLW